MSTAMQKLVNLRVKQVMARDVITIHEESSMSDAAQLLHNYGITGAPVVDDFGRCVGVLSASDFVQSRYEGHCHCAANVVGHADCSESPRAELLENESVRAYMSPHVQKIREHQSIAVAGRIMCHEHIHRLIVVDRQGKPIGIISSLDLVSALVNASEE